MPANLVGEIIFGALHANPRPAPRHARASTRLGAELDGPFDRGRGGPGCWIILDEPEVHLGPHVVVSDIAGWRRERMPRLPETAWFEMPPDCVCEVLSPGTARIDRTDKLAVYAAFGVGHAWCVDPLAKALEVFTLHDGAGGSLAGRTGASADAVASPGAPGAGAPSAPEAPSKKWRLDATFKDDDTVAAPPFEVHSFTLDVLWPEEG